MNIDHDLKLSGLNLQLSLVQLHSIEARSNPLYHCATEINPLYETDISTFFFLLKHAHRLLFVSLLEFHCSIIETFGMVEIQNAQICIFFCIRKKEKLLAGLNALVSCKSVVCLLKENPVVLFKTLAREQLSFYNYVFWQYC